MTTILTHLLGVVVMVVEVVVGVVVVVVLVGGEVVEVQSYTIHFPVSSSIMPDGQAHCS